MVDTAAHAAHAAHEMSVTASNTIRWIVLLPAIGAAINLIAGARIQKINRRAVWLLACAMSLGAFAVVLANFSRLLGMAAEDRLLLDSMFRWMQIGELDVSIAFQFDALSAVMTLVVTGIGSLIHIYSWGYMDDEPHLWRFMGLLNLFMFAMLTLVLGDSILLMFVGWEGVGLCSWGLIGFWHDNHENTGAANKAFLVNRIGDFGVICGMFLLFWTLADSGHGTLVFREMAGVVHHLDGATLWGVSVATLVTLFLFLGATGKSAQIPLYVWLPDAMAGPTPVSALIHAATMVTAGVYMIGRLNFLFAMAPFTGEVIAFVGAATALFAATIGLAQYDIKKVLAYSTVSQLGYMFMAMGIGAYAAGIFHLVTHAFFKACLFLGSGSVIHAMHHEQDMRKMGGLRTYMPITFATFFISTLAIAGLPPLAGFFSKDEILWKAYLHNPVLWGIGFAAAGMTAFYMFRQVFMTFFGECRADHHTQEHLHESPAVITVPLVILAIGAVTVGWLGIPAALGGSNHFEHWLEPVFAAGAHGGGHGHGHHDLTVEYMLMGASIGIALAGITLAYLMYNRQTIKPEFFSEMGGGVPHRLIFNKYYVDEIYYGTVLAGTLALSRALAWFDRVVVDGIVNATATVTNVVGNLNGAIDRIFVDGAVNGVAAVAQGAGGTLRRLQTGSINGYLYVILIVVTAVLLIAEY